MEPTEVAAMEAAGKAVTHEGLSGEAGTADEAVVHEASIDEKAMVEAVMEVTMAEKERAPEPKNGPP